MLLRERGEEISFHSNNAPRSLGDHYNVEMPNFSLRLLKTDGGRGGGDKGKNPFAICDFFKVGRRL